MSPSGLSWEVTLPERGRAGGFRSRPRAILTVASEEGGEETFSVPVAVGRRLRALPEMGSRAELLWKLRRLELACAHDRMEELVNRRDYAERELRDKLVECGYPSAVAEEVSGRAREAGVVDDARFAAAFARSKVLSGWGMRRIERELERRGVELEGVPGWPDEFFSPGDERERARQLASRRRLTGRNDYPRLVRFLVSRGFAPGLSSDVAREVLDAARREGDARLD